MNHKTLSVTFKENSVDIPYIEIEGKEKGHHIFLSGGMHGDEINGIAVINEFLQWAERKELEKHLKGKITVLPVLNPSGFTHIERYVHEDEHDLNRCFGIEEPETLAEQMAYDLTHKIFKNCGFGLDFHDAGGSSVLIPHTRVHSDETCNLVYGCTKDIGRMFGTEIIVEREGKPGMMAVELYQKYNIPVLTIETGGAQKIFPEHVEIALRGIRNILAVHEMYNSPIDVPAHQYYLYDRHGVKTKEPGQIHFNIELGDTVHADQEIGQIYYPISQKRQKLIAPMCGYVFSLWQQEQIQSGGTMYSILEKKQCHVTRTTLDLFEELGPFDIKQVHM